MKNRYKAVLFDLDGTLLDTNNLIWETYLHLFRKYRPDYEVSKEELLYFLGPPLSEVFPKYFKEDFEELFNEYRDYNFKIHQDFAKPIDGALDILKYLKEEGYKIAIITSKAKDAAELGLRIFKMIDYVDLIIGIFDVDNPKPNPEGINKALEYFNVLPNEALMVGDSSSDLKASINAKTTTVGVKYSIKGYQHLLELNPDYMIDSLLEIKDIVNAAK